MSFRYPDTSVDVLAGIDLFLPAGTTVAIVGENGAGKTTIVKLLCRFYEPTEGRITVDGDDLRRLPIDEWRAHLSGAFQDHARLEFLAQETVGVGRLEAINDAARLDEPTATLDLPWVFASDDAHHQRVGAGVLEQRFRRVRTEAGIDALLHRLRYSLATFLLGRGALLQAQARLRHRRRGHHPAGVIGHLDDASVKRLADQWATAPPEKAAVA